MEKLSEKAEGRTVEKSTFLEETTHSPAAETSTEKVSKEPIFSQTTTANTEPKQDIHTQKEIGTVIFLSLTIVKALYAEPATFADLKSSIKFAKASFR